jgi:hypothetical protein
MGATVGMRGTGSFSSDERPTNYREKILREYPDGPAVLLMVLGMLRNEVVDDPKFTIFQESLPIQRWPVVANYNTTATNIELDDLGTYYPDTAYDYPARYFKAGDLVRNDTTEEVMLVTGVGTDTDADLTVVRGVGTDNYGTSGSAGTAGQYLTIIGNANEEGATYTDGPTEDPSTVYNYIEEFRTSFQLTGTAKVTRYRTGNMEKNKKFFASMQHSMALEKAFLFGKRQTTTGTNGQALRMTGGLSHFVTSNVTDFSSTGLSKDGLEDALRDIYTVPGGSKNKIAFCGNQFMGIINRLGEAHLCINVEPRDTTYGLQIRNYVHAWGELKLVAHPLLSEHAVWTKNAFIVDTRNIAYRYLPTYDTKLRRNIQNPGVDGVVHEWMTKCGLELQHERTHGILTGVDTFIA